MPNADGQLIRHTRTTRSLEPATVAERCRITLKAYLQIEAGTQNPSVEVVYRLATTLGLRPGHITPGLIDGAKARTLRDRRRAKGLKLSELAARIGVSISHLSNAEHGIRSLGPDALARAGEIFGCDPAAIETPRAAA